jgi:hypothetical protein
MKELRPGNPLSTTSGNLALLVASVVAGWLWTVAGPGAAFKAGAMRRGTSEDSDGPPKKTRLIVAAPLDDRLVSGIRAPGL